MFPKASIGTCGSAQRPGALPRLPQMREGYGGGVPLYTNCHYAWRNWYEYSGGQMNDWGAHHVDIATWALGAGDTGPSKITPVSYSLPVEYANGYPTVSDRYNSPTKFEIHANMPGDILADHHQRGRKRHSVRGNRGSLLCQSRQALGQACRGSGKQSAARRRRRRRLRWPCQRESYCQLYRGDGFSSNLSPMSGPTIGCSRFVTWQISRFAWDANLLGIRSSERSSGTTKPTCSFRERIAKATKSKCSADSPVELLQSRQSLIVRFSTLRAQGVRGRAESTCSIPSAVIVSSADLVTISSFSSCCSRSVVGKQRVVFKLEPGDNST